MVRAQIAVAAVAPIAVLAALVSVCLRQLRVNDVAAQAPRCLHGTCAALAKDDVLLQLGSRPSQLKRSVNPEGHMATVLVAGSMAEFVLLPCGLNVALHKPVTCSANLERCGRTVVDGVIDLEQVDSAPRGTVRECTERAWVQIDLQRLTRVNLATLFAYSDGARQYCGRKVEVSVDGETWSTVVDGGDRFSPVERPRGTAMGLGAPRDVRYVKVHSSRNSLNRAVDFLDIELTCWLQQDCCEATTTTTTQPGAPPVWCPPLSTQPHRCGPNIGRCNPALNPDGGRHCAESYGWCDPDDPDDVNSRIVDFHHGEYNYETEHCGLELRGEACVGEPYTFAPGTGCNGWPGPMTEQACFELCRDDAQAEGCPQRRCVASQFRLADGSCHLYDEGQCGSMAEDRSVVTRRKATKLV